MMMHHAVASVSLASALSSHQGHMYTLLLLATELTTPFINARWHLDAVVRLIPCAFSLLPILLRQASHCTSLVRQARHLHGGSHVAALLCLMVGLQVCVLVSWARAMALKWVNVARGCL